MTMTMIDKGRLALHFESIHVSTMEDRLLVVNKFKYTVRELDLSNNSLQYVTADACTTFAPCTHWLIANSLTVDG
jgi:hypothetical protein